MSRSLTGIGIIWVFLEVLGLPNDAFCRELQVPDIPIERLEQNPNLRSLNRLSVNHVLRARFARASNSNPPGFRTTETVIVDKLWQGVKRHCEMSEYEFAHIAVEQMERYISLPELTWAKAIISFRRGDLETAGEIISSEEFCMDAAAQAFAGLVHFERQNDRKALEVWKGISSSNEKNKLAGLGLCVLRFVNGQKGWVECFSRCDDTYRELLVSMPNSRMGKNLAIMAKSLQTQAAFDHRGKANKANFHNVAAKVTRDWRVQHIDRRKVTKRIEIRSY